MFNFVKENISIIVILILIIISIYFYIKIEIYKNKIYEAESNNRDLNYKLAIEESNNKKLKDSVDKQSQALSQIKVDYNNNLQKFEEWKNRPAEVRYKEIIKYKEIKSNECEDVKSIINSIRSTSF